MAAAMVTALQSACLGQAVAAAALAEEVAQVPTMVGDWVRERILASSLREMMAVAVVERMVAAAARPMGDSAGAQQAPAIEVTTLGG